MTSQATPTDTLKKTTERIQPEQRFAVTTGGNAAERTILHGEMGRELVHRSNINIHFLDD